MRHFVLWVSIFACPEVCDLLGYEFSIRLAPNRCYCADLVNTKDPMAIPNFNLRMRPEKKEPAEQYDDRAKRQYGDD